MRQLLFLSFLFCIAINALAQKTKKTQETQTKIEKSSITGKDVEWHIKGVDKIIVRDSSNHYIQIFIDHTHPTLYGNRCAEELAKKKRIEFIIKESKHSKYGSRNFTNHIRAFFRNGPFWKRRLKKKIKKCRISTGDYIG